MSIRYSSLLLATIVFAGCPDPSATSAGVEEDPTQAGTEATLGNNGPAQQESDPNSARFDCNVDECVELGGEFVYAGAPSGQIRIDVQKFRDGAAPSLVHTDELKKLGPFSINVPKNFGKVVITGFIDKDGNGPTTDDPQGRVSVEVGEKSETDLVLEVKDDNPPPATDPTGQVPGQNSPPPPSEGEKQENATQPQAPDNAQGVQAAPEQLDKTAPRDETQPTEPAPQGGPPADN